MEDDLVPEIKEPIIEEINAPDQNKVTSDDDDDMITEALERLAKNNLYGALVVFDTRTQSHGTQYIFDTGVGYLMTTSTYYEGTENFAQNFNINKARSWNLLETDEGTTTISSDNSPDEYSITGYLGTD